MGRKNILLFCLLLVITLVLPSFVVVQSNESNQANNEKEEISDDLGDIGKDISKAEELLRKTQEEERELTPQDYMEILDDTIKLMGKIQNDFFKASTSKIQDMQTKTIENIGKLLEQILRGEVLPKEDKTIANLEKLIKNAKASMNQSQQQSQKDNEQQSKEQDKELQKLLEKMRQEQEKQKKQDKKNDRNAQQPAPQAYDAAVRSSDIRDLKAGGGISERWGILPPKLREEVIHSMNEKRIPEYEKLIQKYYEAIDKAVVKSKK